ncbi:MAG: ADP-glucose pyrophosphorylase [Rhodospirillaceae bacterium]|nr:ADP-glucose pyrophosphorylase [Rhodospirillaceae bacterium]
MRAIILAAGLGSRLMNKAGEIPKILIKVGGQTLLERHLRILSDLSITEVVIGVGYKSNLIIDELINLKREDVKLVYNPNFDQGSIVTLQKLAPELRQDGGIIIMDGDVLYDIRILKCLINSKHENCFLLDRNIEDGEEPMKLAINNGSIVDFRKKIEKPCDYYGESVGFFKFSTTTAQSIANTCSQMISSGLQETYMEEVIRYELLKNPKIFAFEDITGLPWIEIDFPEDLTKAETKILPSLIIGD